MAGAFFLAHAVPDKALLHVAAGRAIQQLERFKRVLGLVLPGRRARLPAA